MKAIIGLGIAASFLGGAALALLISYPLPRYTDYVLFIALFIALIACVLGAWSMILEATMRNRVHTDRIVEATVDHLLSRRGLELVDGD